MVTSNSVLETAVDVCCQYFLDLGKLQQGDSRQQAEITMSHGFTCTKPKSAAKIPIHSSSIACKR